MDYVLKMKFKHAKKLIDKAIKERDAENLFKVYLVDRQHQLYLLANGAIKKGDVLTFNQYYDRALPQKTQMDNRTQDEILAEIMALKFETKE